MARQLCAVRRGVAFPTVLAGVSRLPGAAPITAGLAAAASGFDTVSDVDVEAARLTSFPPALTSALKKAAEGPRLDSHRAVVHLWMVEPHQDAAGARSRSSTLQRIDVLGEI